MHVTNAAKTEKVARPSRPWPSPEQLPQSEPLFGRGRGGRGLEKGLEAPPPWCGVHPPHADTERISTRLGHGSHTVHCIVPLPGPGTCGGCPHPPRPLTDPSPLPLTPPGPGPSRVGVNRTGGVQASWPPKPQAGGGGGRATHGCAAQGPGRCHPRGPATGSGPSKARRDLIDKLGAPRS